MGASLGGVRIDKLMAHVDFGVTLVIVIAGSMPRSASSTTGRASSYERPLGLCQRLNRLTVFWTYWQWGFPAGLYRVFRTAASRGSRTEQQVLVPPRNSPNHAVRT